MFAIALVLVGYFVYNVQGSKKQRAHTDTHAKKHQSTFTDKRLFSSFLLNIASKRASTTYTLTRNWLESKRDMRRKINETWTFQLPKKQQQQHKRYSREHYKKQAKSLEIKRYKHYTINKL